MLSGVCGGKAAESSLPRDALSRDERLRYPGVYFVHMIAGGEIARGELAGGGLAGGGLAGGGLAGGNFLLIR